MVKFRCVVSDFLIADQVRVTADAILLDHLAALLPDKDHLGFPAEGEDNGMSYSVLGFEPVFSGHCVMGNMAVITVGLLPVGAVTPRGVLGCHDVAVHAG
jgi:hypothetical protein